MAKSKFHDNHWTPSRRRFQGEVARRGAATRKAFVASNPKEKNKVIKFRSQNNRHPIAIMRMKLNWFQVDLANHLGVSKISVQNWERGRGNPRKAKRDLMDKLCMENGIDIIDWENTL